MKLNNYHRTGVAIAAFLLTLAAYCWLNILAPNGPTLWFSVEVALPLKYSSTEFPAIMVRRAVRDTAFSIGIAYNPKLPLPRIFILPKKDMAKIFGAKIIAGIYFHHPYMQPKIFVTKRQYNHLTGHEMVRGIMRYLSDTYPDEFDIRRIPFIERKMARAYQAC